MNMDVHWPNHSFNDNLRKWPLGVCTAQTANTRTPTTRAIAQPKARTAIIQASRLLGIVGETGAHALARQIERGRDPAHAAHTQAKANDGLAGGRGTCIKLRHLKPFITSVRLCLRCGAHRKARTLIAERIRLLGVARKALAREMAIGPERCSLGASDVLSGQGESVDRCGRGWASNVAGHAAPFIRPRDWGRPNISRIPGQVPRLSQRVDYSASSAKQPHPFA